MSAILGEGIGFGGNDNESSSESPTIILKKGKVELKIRNAAAVIKKVNELYPTDSSYTGWNINWNRKHRELSDFERAKQIRWMEAAKNWFKEEIFGGLNDFEVIVSNNEQTNKNVTTPIPVKYNEETNTLSTPSPTPTNKNAYEIRESILDKSIGIVNSSISMDRNGIDGNVDQILQVAERLYEFVENKKRNKS